MNNIALHHISYDRLGRELLNQDFVPLCKNCHKKVHLLIKGHKSYLSEAHLCLRGDVPPRNDTATKLAKKQIKSNKQLTNQRNQHKKAKRQKRAERKAKRIQQQKDNIVSKKQSRAEKRRVRSERRSQNIKDNN